MEDSIFTKIIKGEIPCSKVYEDEKTLAILDIHPFTPGHSLVIPKQQVSHFDQLDEDNYRAVFATVKIIATKLKQVTGCERVCLRVEGFDVPHTHVHVYPCNTPGDFYGSSDRLQIEPDIDALNIMAKKLAF